MTDNTYKHTHLIPSQSRENMNEKKMHFIAPQQFLIKINFL